MSILPVRKLGQVGIITDLNPKDLPPNGFSSGNNVRFDEGKVKRAPVFRKVFNTAASNPAYVFTMTPSTGYDQIITVSEDGSLKSFSNNTEVDVTPTGFSPVVTSQPFTSCNLGGVTYVNRKSDVPYYMGSAGTRFAALPAWDSTWRCGSLRAYKDFLIALDVIKGATEYPTMVKWSDIVQSGSTPGSWDVADTTKSAGENILAQMTTPLVDGFSLRDSFILYSSNSVWVMDYTGTNDIFSFRPLFQDVGIINQNCAVEVDGKHYVFGLDDIYVHDGNTKQSLASNRVRSFIYRGLNVRKANLCFVAHNVKLAEIYFCYVSGDELVGFSGTTRCNRAAVYNYRNDVWSFMDLPSIAAMTRANVNTTLTFDQAAGLQYDLVGGSFFDQEDTFDKNLIAVGVQDTANGLTASRIYGVDLSEAGSMAYNIELETVRDAFVERVGFDLDEVGAELRGYKFMRAMYPQALSFGPAGSMMFRLGAADLPDQPTHYDPYKVFDPESSYKVDTRQSGHYPAYSMKHSSYYGFEFSGFDIDVVLTGKR